MWRRASLVVVVGAVRLLAVAGLSNRAARLKSSAFREIAPRRLAGGAVSWAVCRCSVCRSVWPLAAVRPGPLARYRPPPAGRREVVRVVAARLRVEARRGVRAAAARGWPVLLAVWGLAAWSVG